ncbi:hypothetical protein IC575_018505 [Cucumis melo]|uniref:Uncharacterized protein LOC103484640 n=1 Tax=Cucumis melo TaxID=3656 RepID=A0A1S3AZS4_CUCME|nr:uncharacterized protein LOC103484640 [Cucumis melo]
MEEQTGGTKPIKCRGDQKRQKYGSDGAGFSTGDLPIGNLDAPPHSEDEDSHISTSEDSGSSGEERRLSGLAESLQILTKSLLTAEMEIFKATEFIRLEEERRRLESEVEMTSMLLQCQLQIASFLSAMVSPNIRKRKRVQEEDPSSSVTLERNRALLLSMLQLNMFTF